MAFKKILIYFFAIKPIYAIKPAHATSSVIAPEFLYRPASETVYRSQFRATARRRPAAGVDGPPSAAASGPILLGRLATIFLATCQNMMKFVPSTTRLRTAGKTGFGKHLLLPVGTCRRETARDMRALGTCTFCADCRKYPYGLGLRNIQ